MFKKPAIWRADNKQEMELRRRNIFAVGAQPAAPNAAPKDFYFPAAKQ
jgi:hypothetical protein